MPAAPTPNGQAQSASGTVPTLVSINTFTSSNRLKFSLTADNAGGTAAISPVYLKPQVQVAANQTLPAGVTYAGDFASWAEFMDYLLHIRNRIRGFQIQSADTTNFARGIEIGEALPNLLIPKKQLIDFTGYRQSNGNGYSDTIVITDITPIIFWPALYALLQGINKNSTMTFTLFIDSWDQPTELANVSF